MPSLRPPISAEIAARATEIQQAPVSAQQVRNVRMAFNSTSRIQGLFTGPAGVAFGALRIPSGPVAAILQAMDESGEFNRTGAFRHPGCDLLHETAVVLRNGNPTERFELLRRIRQSLDRDPTGQWPPADDSIPVYR